MSHYKSVVARFDLFGRLYNNINRVRLSPKIEITERQHFASTERALMLNFNLVIRMSINLVPTEFIKSNIVILC